MRDVFAAVAALVLLVVAASLATTLQAYRRRRVRARDSERALGRTVIAEIPAGDELVLFSEDRSRFYYGERSIDKDLIAAVRVLINGSPIAAYASRRLPRSRGGAGHQLRGSAGRHRARSLGRRHRDGDRHGAGRMRRDPRARVAGTGAHGLRCGQARDGAARRGSGLGAGRWAGRSVPHHSVSGAPARWFTTRARTNSRSDRRLT